MPVHLHGLFVDNIGLFAGLLALHLLAPECRQKVSPPGDNKAQSARKEWKDI
jgi:hypothetical protein